MVQLKAEQVVWGILLFVGTTRVLALVGFKDTKQGLCTQTYTVTRTKTKAESVYVTYQQSRSVRMWYGRTKTRWDTFGHTITKTVPVEYTEQESKTVCCAGYAEKYDFQTYNSRQVCSPVCRETCQNGECTAPEFCSCQSGYRNYAYNRYLCSPVCSKECTNGKCVLPETCACNIGYRKDDLDRHKCVAVCDSGCRFGRCVAPDTCSCLPGFVVDPEDKFNCLPKCNNACVNGKCTAPNTCTCEVGFANDPVKSHVCNPVCSNECVNGVCVKPESCDCLDGYEKDAQESYLCHPICHEKCVNGTCTAPDICECNTGFKKQGNSSNICEPHCSKDCLNGHCGSPEKCTCNFGFVLDQNDLYTCLPICAKECINGYCTKPDHCTCWSGYKLNPVDKFVCKAVCTIECVNGKCVFPETCDCDEGFVANKEDPYLCEPSCDFQCINSNCTSPNYCECFAGYVRDGKRSNVCNPVCSQECYNGECVSPDVCECSEGYEKFNSSSNCVPSCSECKNGICLAPENCVCWDNYENPEDRNSTCVPVCDQECVNSFCSAPNECACDEGYAHIINDWTTCVAVCDKPCVNGNCSAPNSCECFPGYDSDVGSNLCNPVCSEDCVNAVCTEPETCTCFLGFERSDEGMNCSKSDDSVTDCSFLLTLEPGVFSDRIITTETNLRLENQCVFFDLIALLHEPLTINLNCSRRLSNSIDDYLNLICTTDSVLHQKNTFYTSSTVETSSDKISEFSTETEIIPSHESSTNTVSVPTTDNKFFADNYTSESSTLESISSADTSQQSVSYDQSSTEYSHQDNNFPLFSSRNFYRRSLDENIILDEEEISSGSSSATTLDPTSTSEEFHSASLLELSSELPVINETEETDWESTLDVYHSPNVLKEKEKEQDSNYFKSINPKNNKALVVKIEISNEEFIAKERITKNYFNGERNDNWPRCYCIKSLKWKDILENGFQLQLKVCSCVKTLSRHDPAVLKEWSLDWWNILWIIICATVLLSFITFTLFCFVRKRRLFKKNSDIAAEHDHIRRIVDYQNEKIFCGRDQLETWQESYDR